MSDYGLLTTINIGDKIEEAKQWAQDQLDSAPKLQPLLSLYKSRQHFCDFLFPETDDPDERQQSFYDAAWIGSAFTCSTMRLIIDTTLGDDQQGTTDAIVCVFATEQGVMGDISSYSRHPEVKGLVWDNESKIGSKDVMDSNPFLIAFMAAQFHFEGPSVPWRYYIEYLKSKGFGFSLAAPWTEANYGYGQRHHL